MLEVLQKTAIKGNGDISGTDHAFLANNRLWEADDPDLSYPRPVAADLVFAEIESGDLGVELDVF